MPMLHLYNALSISSAQVTCNATAHLDSWRLWDVSGRGHGSLDQSGVHRAAVSSLCRHLTSGLHAHFLDEPRKLLLHILHSRLQQSVLCQHVIAQQHRQPFLHCAHRCRLSSMPCCGFCRLCTCESSVAADGHCHVTHVHTKGPGKAEVQAKLANKAPYGTAAHTTQ